MTQQQQISMARQIMIWEEMGLGDEQIDNAMVSLGYTQEQIDAINDAYCDIVSTAKWDIN